MNYLDHLAILVQNTQKVFEDEDLKYFFELTYEFLNK